MNDVIAKKILEEIKKIHGDQDKIQAYLKTIAENTTPAETPEEPAGT